MKQFYHLLIILLLLNSCYKPVYTEYFQEENYTEFTTHEILIEIPSDRMLKSFPSRNVLEEQSVKLKKSSLDYHLIQNSHSLKEKILAFFRMTKRSISIKEDIFSIIILELLTLMVHLDLPLNNGSCGLIQRISKKSFKIRIIS